MKKSWLGKTFDIHQIVRTCTVHSSVRLQQIFDWIQVWTLARSFTSIDLLFKAIILLIAKNALGYCLAGRWNQNCSNQLAFVAMIPSTLIKSIWRKAAVKPDTATTMLRRGNIVILWCVNYGILLRFGIGLIRPWHI